MYVQAVVVKKKKRKNKLSTARLVCHEYPHLVFPPPCRLFRRSSGSDKLSPRIPSCHEFLLLQTVVLRSSGLTVRHRALVSVPSLQIMNQRFPPAMALTGAVRGTGPENVGAKETRLLCSHLPARLCAAPPTPHKRTLSFSARTTRSPIRPKPRRHAFPIGQSFRRPFRSAGATSAGLVRRRCILRALPIVPGGKGY